MDPLKILAIGAVLAAASLSTNACVLTAQQHYVKFQPGSISLTAGEIKRFAEWRVASRRLFYSGFDAYFVGWEGNGITHEMATARVAQVRMLLLNSGFPPVDLRDSEMRPAKSSSIRQGPDAVRIDVVARCPNYCCSLEPLPDNIAR